MLWLRSLLTYIHCGSQWQSEEGSRRASRSAGACFEPGNVVLLATTKASADKWGL